MNFNLAEAEEERQDSIQNLCIRRSSRFPAASTLDIGKWRMVYLPRTVETRALDWLVEPNSRLANIHQELDCEVAQALRQAKIFDFEF